MRKQGIVLYVVELKPVANESFHTVIATLLELSIVFNPLSSRTLLQIPCIPIICPYIVKLASMIMHRSILMVFPVNIQRHFWGFSFSCGPDSSRSCRHEVESAQLKEDRRRNRWRFRNLQAMALIFWMRALRGLPPALAVGIRTALRIPPEVHLNGGGDLLDGASRERLRVSTLPPPSAMSTLRSALRTSSTALPKYLAINAIREQRRDTRAPVLGCLHCLNAHHHGLECPRDGPSP